MKTVLVSIINFNGNSDTIECLKSLKNVKRTSYDLKVVVIDNASERPITLREIGVTPINIHIIHNDKNLGFSGGHNTGIKYGLSIDASYILFLNNDTLLDINFIEELFRVAEQDSKIGVCVPKIYFAKGFEFHKDRYSQSEKGKVIWYAGGIMDWKNVAGSHRGVDEVENYKYDLVSETDYATGCCMMVKSSIFKKIVGFDDRYFLYYEDVALNQIIKSLGYKIMFVPKSIIWHKNAKSAGGSGSPLQDYYITRNRMLLGFTFAKIRAKLALVKESIKLLLSGREWQKKGIRDFYLRRFGKGSFGE